MIRPLSLLVAALPFVAASDDPPITAPYTWNFEADTPGAPPRGFTAAEGDWKVVEAGGSKHLAQRASNPKPVFNLILVDGVKAKDLDLSVRFEAIAGDIDRGGGLVWRAQDAKNYYVARYNPLEDNYRLYKVVDGVRTQFLNADIPHTDGPHTLRITMIGDRIECFYDGKKSLEFRDRTFAEAGGIGLWTKSDARTRFDNLSISDE